MNILEMGREQLLALNQDEVDCLLTAQEVVHIASTLGAFWRYDYEAAGRGKVGKHARLKSERHSDGFFVFKILLEPWNIRYLMADQIVMRLNQAGVPCPDYVAGIPDGATKLGEEVAWKLGAKLAQMEKVDGRICLITPLQDGDQLLLVEDFCTRGTGFTEAVKAVLENYPKTKILPFDPVILNRGGLKEVVVEGVGSFTVLPVVECRVQDWEAGAATCPLCAKGSVAIKPKATEESWRDITTSQL